MKKIAWITDSTCGLSPEFIKEHDIHVLPMNVIFGQESFKEDIDLTKEEFYQRLKDAPEAKTSQPAYGEFIELYEKLKKEYDVGIAVHASSQLTGTYQSSLSASDQTGFLVNVIDSKIGDYAVGKMIQMGIEMQKSGKSYEEIVKVVHTLPNKAKMYLLPSNLEQLRKSGRVTTTQSVFASLLNVKLIIGFQDGKVIVEEKIRTEKKAKLKMLQVVKEAVEADKTDEICILHANNEEKATEWANELTFLYPKLVVKNQVLVPVAGVHTGYGTLCVTWLEK